MVARAVLVAALVAGCSKSPPPDKAVSEIGPSPASVRPAIDATPAAIDAQPATDTVPPAPSEVELPLAEILGLDQKQPPRGALGLEVGSVHKENRYVRAKLADFAGCTAGFFTKPGDDGQTVEIVTGEIECAAMGDSNDQFAAMEKRLAEIEGAITAALGKPAQRHGARRWAGKKSQLYVETWDGFLRGTPSLLLHIFPPGTKHVCGAGDGFKPFYANFRKALNGGSVPAVMLHLDPDDDQLECSGDGAEYAKCAAPIARRIAKTRKFPYCDLSGPAYKWDEQLPTHGGSMFSFVRQKGEWKAMGPRQKGHDDE